MSDQAFIDSWRYRNDRVAPDDKVKLSEWLGRIRYKPDTRFEISPVFSHVGCLQIVVLRHLADSTKGLMTLTEALDPRNHVKVAATFEVPPYYLRTDDFDAFVHWIHQELFGMEKHEMDEWFRVDNHLPFDPHKER